MENKNITSEIEKLSLSELKSLVRQVKEFRDLDKKLGVRGKELFKRGLLGTKLLVVEYFPSIGEELAFEKASFVYKTMFSAEVTKAQIKFIPKAELLGGIKVFCDDNMIDLSFSKIEKHIKG